MAAIIDSQHKVADFWGAGIHGFTSGDAPANSRPTELTAGWCNTVQQEINNGIVAGGLTLSGASNTQLAAALEAVALEVRPRTSGRTVTRFLFDNDSTTTQTWGRYSKTARTVELVGGGAAFDFATISEIPNNSLVLVNWRLVCVQANNTANYYTEQGQGSFIRGTNSATSEVKSYFATFSDSNSAALTCVLGETGAGYPTLRLNPFALAAGPWNILAEVSATVVARTL